MKRMEVQVEISGIDDYGNTIKPYLLTNIHRHVKWEPHYKIGSNILENVKTKTVEKIVKIFSIYEKEFNCDNCEDWGCEKCCSSQEEIRNRQGIFS